MDTPERFTEAALRAFWQKHKDVQYHSKTRRPRIAFLPEGEHRVRFFWDPNAMLMRELGIHRMGKLKAHCLEYLKRSNPRADYPQCTICTLYEQTRIWFQRPEILTLVYGYVYATSHRTQYWDPGRPYVIIGDRRFAQALQDLSRALPHWHPVLLPTLFKPQEPGPITLVTVEKGRQSAVTMTPQLDDSHPPITLGPWYQPLEQVWIPLTFSPTDYAAVHAALTQHSAT